MTQEANSSIDSPSLCFFAASLTKNPSPTAAASVSMQMILLSGYSCCYSSRIFECIVKNCKVWLNAKSKTFSALCGEDFTHKEVLLAHAACVLLIVACGVAGRLEGGAL